MSIDYKKITVVIQGDIRPETASTIYSVRKNLPGATILLSTFHNELHEHYKSHVDELILSHDPGPLPPYVKSNHAPYNNTNRQIRSTKNALAYVKTEYALKIRSDCILLNIGFIKLYCKYAKSVLQENRIVANSHFTRHPAGLCRYLFHISDWFIFGKTQCVRNFFSCDEISISDATWYDRNAHNKNSTYNAKRFRARFTPEQFITIRFAQNLGYETPYHLNDNNKEKSTSYLEFLKNEVIIGSPEDLGFKLEKYDHINESLYQKIDCISHEDWLKIAAKKKKTTWTYFDYSSQN